MEPKELLNIALPILQGLLASGHYTDTDADEKPYIADNAVRDAVMLAYDLMTECEGEASD